MKRRRSGWPHNYIAPFVVHRWYTFLHHQCEINVYLKIVQFHNIINNRRNKIFKSPIVVKLTSLRPRVMTASSSFRLIPHHQTLHNALIVSDCRHSAIIRPRFTNTTITPHSILDRWFDGEVSKTGLDEIWHCIPLTFIFSGLVKYFCGNTMSNLINRSPFSKGLRWWGMPSPTTRRTDPETKNYCNSILIVQFNLIETSPWNNFINKSIYTVRRLYDYHKNVHQQKLE